MPGHVRFRGMPNSRWWEFETSETDFGSVKPEKRDLAKLMFMDFMLIHGDDWYLVPVDVPVGSVAQITGLFVHDTFGVATRIDRADAVAGTSTTTPGQQWTMFSPTWLGHAPKVGSYLVVPASIWPTALSSPTIEEVRLVRDPVADMVWGVEKSSRARLAIHGRDANAITEANPRDRRNRSRARAPRRWNTATHIGAGELDSVRRRSAGKRGRFHVCSVPCCPATMSRACGPPDASCSSSSCASRRCRRKEPCCRVSCIARGGSTVRRACGFRAVADTAVGPDRAGCDSTSPLEMPAPDDQA